VWHLKFSGGSGWFLVKVGAVSRVDVRMSIDSRRIEKVFSVMQTVAENGNGNVHVGAVADLLRAENAPVPVWQLRADCTSLSDLGLISLDPASGAWQIAKDQQEQGAA